MGGWSPEVDVEDPDGEEDREGDKDHGEQKVLEGYVSKEIEEDEYLAKERHCYGGGRDDLRQEKEEHSEGEEDGDGERDLLARLRRKVEHQHRQEGDADTWDDQVNLRRKYT